MSGSTDPMVRLFRNLDGRRLEVFMSGEGKERRIWRVYWLADSWGDRS